VSRFCYKIPIDPTDALGSIGILQLYRDTLERSLRSERALEVGERGGAGDQRELFSGRGQGGSEIREEEGEGPEDQGGTTNFKFYR
jgi:hypothetical protein